MALFCAGLCLFIFDLGRFFCVDFGLPLCFPGCSCIFLFMYIFCPLFLVARTWILLTCVFSSLFICVFSSVFCRPSRTASLFRVGDFGFLTWLFVLVTNTVNCSIFYCFASSYCGITISRVPFCQAIWGRAISRLPSCVKLFGNLQGLALLEAIGELQIAGFRFSSSYWGSLLSCVKL